MLVFISAILMNNPVSLVVLYSHQNGLSFPSLDVDTIELMNLSTKRYVDFSELHVFHQAVSFIPIRLFFSQGEFSSEDGLTLGKDSSLRMCVWPTDSFISDSLVDSN